MGDRTYTDIKFSGTISREVAKELLEAINGDWLQANNSEKAAGQLTIDDLENANYFYGHEVNYAELELIEACCHEHSIPYVKTWAQGGDYGPGMTVFNGEDVHECACLDGEPVVTRRQLLELGTGILEYFDRFDFPSDRYPPLTIVDGDIGEEDD